MLHTRKYLTRTHCKQIFIKMNKIKLQNPNSPSMYGGDFLFKIHSCNSKPGLFGIRNILEISIYKNTKLNWMGSIFFLFREKRVGGFVSQKINNNSPQEVKTIKSFLFNKFTFNHSKNKQFTPLGNHTTFLVLKILKMCCL